MLSHPRLVTSLALLGLLPFFACVLDYHFTTVSIFNSPVQVFVAYSAVILSFLSGSLWGLELHQKKAETKIILILSNVFAVIAWLSLVIEAISLMWSVTLLALSYLVLWISEMILKIYPDDNYRGLRTKLNLLVTGLHVLMFL